MNKEIYIPVEIGNVKFKNPFFVASGPTTKNLKQLIEIERTGWAGASLKLAIDPAPYINRKPRYALFEDRNALAFTTEKRLTMDQGLTLMSDAKKVLRELKLMANITYAGDQGVDGWVNMARKFEQAGADIIELNMCCPNMSYNLQLTSGDQQIAKQQTGASMGQNEEIASSIVREIKKNINIPLFVKLTPEGGGIAKVAKAVLDAGADAVGGTGNRMGMPPINLKDPEKAFYHLQDEISMSCHCGTWLKPLAQRDTYEIRKSCGLEPFITATGGITNWQDAVEMMLCGGSLLGICSETLINGYDIVKPMISGLKQYMDNNGYKTTSEFCGIVVDKVKTATEVTLYDGYAKIKNQNLSAPCKSACPQHVPIQAYVKKVADGDFEGAFKTITTGKPMQSICSLICTHPCEDACVRERVDRSVEIKEIKRSVFNYAKQNGLKPLHNKKQPNGHKIAVVGSDCCGAFCALTLAIEGYDVTIYEQDSLFGASMRNEILSSKIDESDLEYLLTEIKDVGINFVGNVEYGKDIDIKTLKSNQYSGVVITTQQQDVSPSIGYDLLDFTQMLREKKEFGSVVIYGQSYLSSEVALAAKKQNPSKTVYLVYDKLKGGKKYITQQLAELTASGVKILSDTRLENFETKPTFFNKADISFEIECDYFVCEQQESLKSKDNIKTQELSDGFVVTEIEQLKTGNIAQVMAIGKNAAVSADKAIRKQSSTLDYDEMPATVKAGDVLQRVGYINDKTKKPPKSSQPFSVQQAIQEASRCLGCGCGEGCALCKKICTDFAPFIADTDKLCIDKDQCVACGMCFNRCPNNNIEMVSTNQKV